MTETKENKAYSSIFTTAKELFWKHGISRVTVEEICRGASVSKMTFYRLFKNKNDVAEKILIQTFDANLKKYRDIMNQNVSFSKKIKQMVILKKEGTADISEEFIKDIFLKDDAGLKKLIEDYTKVTYDYFVSDIKTAQSNGEIRKDIKVEFIVYMLNSMTNILFDDKIKAMYPDSRDAIMEITKFFFYGLKQIED
jgi:AcrR family transcriptional regulator